EEDYWKKISKAHWLKDRDSNTKFFHVVASARKKRNQITKLINNEGDMIQDHQGLCKAAKDYFDELFHQEPHVNEDVTRLIPNQVTEEDNKHLTKEFTKEEYKEAIFSMHADKALGSDGLNPAFYKRFWELCGD
ncbi:endonuclease/exonuclease/phosphatase family protein, partial [Trifolium medium]|nr:endonuclease/exonuclease/phosphatase family protein [Trifolium medium]